MEMRVVLLFFLHPPRKLCFCICVFVCPHCGIVSTTSDKFSGTANKVEYIKLWKCGMSE